MSCVKKSYHVELEDVNYDYISSANGFIPNSLKFKMYVSRVELSRLSFRFVVSLLHQLFETQSREQFFLWLQPLFWGCNANKI